METTIRKSPQDLKKEMMEKARAKARGSDSSNSAAIIKYINPEDCKNRIRILGDDSGSMHGYFEDAKNGIVEFLRNCIPNESSVAVHWLNLLDTGASNLNSNLLQLANLVESTPFDDGGTPLFSRTHAILDAVPTLTRAVLFTDGHPTDSNGDWNQDADDIIEKARGLKVPIDTVFFGVESEYSLKPRKLLQRISEGTGGYFMVFDPNKVSFKTAFKYLAPANRLMLASESIRKEIQEGKRK